MRVQQDADRAVIDRIDRHLGAKDPLLHRHAGFAEQMAELLE